MWHTQRMTNFVTIFLWRFFAPVWHSLKGRIILYTRGGGAMAVIDLNQNEGRIILYTRRGAMPVIDLNKNKGLIILYTRGGGNGSERP